MTGVTVATLEGHSIQCIPSSDGAAIGLVVMGSGIVVDVWLDLPAARRLLAEVVRAGKASAEIAEGVG